MPPPTVQSSGGASATSSEPRRADGSKVFRGPHRYDYFPQAQVYFDPARRLYFFMQANRWTSRPALPPGLGVRIGPSVTLELESDRPYEFHDEVRRYYPEEIQRRERYDEGFDEGYQQGYNDAYGEGYEAAYTASFEQGYRDGYRACVQSRDNGNRGWRDRDRRR